MGLVGKVINNNFMTMKTIINNYLLLIIILVLFSCSKSDDESNKVLANAEGVWLNFDPMNYSSNGGVEGILTYYWIDNSYIKWMSGDKMEDLNKYATYPIRLQYYPLTSSNVYKIFSKKTGFDISYIKELESKGKLEDFCPEIIYINNNFSKFKYISIDQVGILLFNRTSGTNY